MVACHDPANFKCPDDFKPERWLIDDAKLNARCSEPGTNLVVPFGVGKRQCPGRRFVEMELIIIIAKVFILVLVYLIEQIGYTIHLIIYSTIDGTCVQCKFL